MELLLAAFFGLFVPPNQHEVWVSVLSPGKAGAEARATGGSGEGGGGGSRLKNLGRRASFSSGSAKRSASAHEMDPEVIRRFLQDCADIQVTLRTPGALPIRSDTKLL